LIADDLNDRQVKEYRIADNKVGEFSEWDVGKLSFELKELGEVIGFHPHEIEGILKNPNYKFEDYTQEEFNKSESNRIQNFSNKSNELKEQFLDLMCPHCHKEFQIDKSQMEYQPEEY